VVLTGTGCVTSLGLGTAATVEALRRNHVGLRPVSGFDLGNARARIAGQVPSFKAADVDRRLDLDSLNPISRYAVTAGRLALQDAALRVTPANGDRVGTVMGVCNGPSEMGHMDSVFGSSSFQANVSSFSNITANSTAGWVAYSLCLKGVNASLSAGPHAGLQAVGYGYDALVEGRADALLAGAADELYAQTFYNYDGMGWLYEGEHERDYRLRWEEAKRKVLGEGAAALVMETVDHAEARGASILAEMLGYGMSMDAEGFLPASLGSGGLEHAVRLALKRAEISPEQIGLLVWAPQGNLQDRKVLECGEAIWGSAFGNLPLAATTFNTGYIESASILVGVASVLGALRSGEGLWPQRTGIRDLDERRGCCSPAFVLAVASSDVGYNFAAVFCGEWQG
jgi:3-oxoacyl-[acyl-carrier-protein] synthase II